MGVTLDSGALDAFEDCLHQPTHPLRSHFVGWTKYHAEISTPSIAWAEYWRGRRSNAHYIAKVSKMILVVPISRVLAESAANALRHPSRPTGRNSVKHLIDAIVMAHANELNESVYTADTHDFEALWDCFTGVKSIISAVTGQVVRKR